MKVLHLLRDTQLRVLIIDEIHHILAGHIAKQRHFLNVLKYVGNELKIPLVGVGTIDALRAIQTDPQMVNRFEPVSGAVSNMGAITRRTALLLVASGSPGAIRGTGRPADC